MKKLRVAVVAGFLVAAPAITVLGAEETFDGQTLDSQSVPTQILFENTWGAEAEEQWAAEHNEELIDAGIAEPMGDEEQSGAQVMVEEEGIDNPGYDDEANPGDGQDEDD
jgi:hypothetical protein